MRKNNLTIFANFFIDNEERFLRMKDSFHSLKQIHVDQYVINVRGIYAIKVIEWLRNQSIKVKIYSLKSELGWFYDSYSIAKYIETSYVLIWVEDQICMNPQLINNVVDEMLECDADILNYSYWKNGKFLKRYKEVQKNDSLNIKWFDHTEEVNKKLIEQGYLVSYLSIMKRELFCRLLLQKNKKLAWPLDTPFNFERPAHDISWLPLRRAVPKEELFAPIDDEQGENDGSSLQSRGLYPLRVGRESYAINKAQSLHYRVLRKLSRGYRKINITTSLVFRGLILAPLYLKIKLKSRSLVFKDFLTLQLPNHLVIEFIFKKLSKDINVLEYGPGHFSKFIEGISNKITLVDCNPEIHSITKSSLSSINIYQCMLIEPEACQEKIAHFYDDPARFDSVDFMGYSLEKYVGVVNSFPDSSIDLIIIAGSSRASCIAASVSKIKSGGMLVLKNSERSRYLKKTLPLISEWERYDFIERVSRHIHFEITTIFVKPI